MMRSLAKVKADSLEYNNEHVLDKIGVCIVQVLQGKDIQSYLLVRGMNVGQSGPRTP